MATWRNWGRSAVSHPQEIAVPVSESDVVDLLGRAATQGQTIRPVGSGHSFTPIAATDSILLRLSALSGLIDIDRATGEVTFGAGTCLADVPDLLAPYGLAMENLGDIDHQTIAGAISTGTHGTGLGFTGLAGQVTGMRIITADGSVIDADAAHHPDLFAVARLGLGAFGVLTRIRIQCVPAFQLAADEHPESLDDLLAQFPERAAAVDHLEFYLFPSTDIAAVKENTRLPADATPSPRSGLRAYFEDEVVQNFLFGAMCAVGATVPASIDAMNSVAARTMSRTTYTDVSTAIFTTSRRVKFREMEYGIDLEALPTALNQVRRLIADNNWHISFPIEVRVAAADNVPLSTAYGRPTAYVAVHRFVAEPYARYFLAVEQILLTHGGRPHWGKLHSLNAGDLQGRYPMYDQVRELHADVDPHGLFANRYLSRVLGVRGRPTR